MTLYHTQCVNPFIFPGSYKGTVLHTCSMLPLELWECISFYLENATEVGNLCTALNVPIFLLLKPSMLPVHIRNDMIACTVAHNKKHIFVKIISGGESFLDDLWDLLSFSLPNWSSSTQVCGWRKDMIRWCRHNGGRPWDDLTITNAARYSTIDVVKWLHSQNCPWKKESMCSVAAQDDNIELLLWLIEQGCPCKARHYVTNKQFPKTHKVGNWMERHEKMGPYLEMFDYFNFINPIPCELLEFAI
jgi:hypothetical protein